jgi:hypothetical protein
MHACHLYGVCLATINDLYIGKADSGYGFGETYPARKERQAHYEPGVLFD